MTGNTPHTSALAPFRSRAFALLWTATLMSNIGTWMHDVSAAWLMTSLSPSPFVVALVQATTTAAMAIFALPAGALADLFDRRRLLIAIVLAKAVLASLLGVLTLAGLIDAWGLLAITFLLGVGSALMAPVWQSVVPSLVPRERLKPAVALNGAGINIARAIGPAVGGFIIVSAGVAYAFFLNAASELIILAALLFWRPAAQPSRLPEQFLPAIAAGVRYAAHAPALKIVLRRAAGFFLSASAFWALLPLIVRNAPGADAALYGLAVGVVGVGAVAGALVLPRLDRRLSANTLVMLGSAGMACVLLALALQPSRAVLLGAGLGAGISWILVLSSLNVAAQNALPDWVRGRGLAIYGMVFFGAMTLGALLWGALASVADMSLALLAASAAMAAGMVLLRRQRLPAGAENLMPAGHWPEPVIDQPPASGDGPVMVCVEYRIDPTRADDFVAVMHRLAQERRRDGAYQWGIMRDVADAARYTEYFLLASWSEHERQHARVTQHDAKIQEEVRAFHLGAEPPAVRHLLTAFADRVVP